MGTALAPPGVRARNSYKPMDAMPERWPTWAYRRVLIVDVDARCLAGNSNLVAAKNLGG